MKRYVLLLLALFALASLMASCSPNRVEVEVTRIVENDVEVTRIIETEVEVTRVVEVPVEVTVVSEVEVTRVVEVVIEPTATAKPEEDEVDPSDLFAENYLATVEQDGITVELARVLIGNKETLAGFGIDITEFDLVANDTYMGEVVWRITNNTDEAIRWQYDDIDARVNGRQIDLYDWLFQIYFGEQPTDEIYPGSTIVGGVWFGLGETAPDDIETVSLILGRAINADFDYVSQPIIVDAELSEPHEWIPIPDELSN